MNCINCICLTCSKWEDCQKCIDCTLGKISNEKIECNEHIKCDE